MSKRSLVTSVAVLALALSAGACSGATSHGKSSQPATISAIAPQTAVGVARAMQQAGVADMEGPYDAAKHPTSAGTQSGESTSKTAKSVAVWGSAAIPTKMNYPTVHFGGAIEQFGSTQLAAARYAELIKTWDPAAGGEYGVNPLLGIGSSSLPHGITMEYDYVVGTTVLRISFAIPYGIAQRYVAKFEQVMHAPAPSTLPAGSPTARTCQMLADDFASVTLNKDGVQGLAGDVLGAYLDETHQGPITTQFQDTLYQMRTQLAAVFNNDSNGSPRANSLAAQQQLKNTAEQLLTQHGPCAPFVPTASVSIKLAQ